MRCLSKTVLAFVLGSAFASARAVEETRKIASESERPDDAFAFDVVARSNEALRANVDAIDTGLTAILAGIVAVVVFTMDKMRELGEPERWIVLGILGAATLVCLLGYLVGVSWRGFGKRDGIRPLTFIPDFTRSAEIATMDAIEELTNAGEVNLAVRLWKQILAVVALALLLIGVTLLALARFDGKVV